MLVLTRKLQEKIRIGDQVTITVLRMKGKAVRLGIEAPTDVAVIRGELIFEQDGEAVGRPGNRAGDNSGKLAVPEIASVAGSATSAGAAESIKDRTEPTWARDTHPHPPTSRTRGVEPNSEVRLARVSRDKAAQFLARTAPATGGPLRSMLDERSKAV